MRTVIIVLGIASLTVACSSTATTSTPDASTPSADGGDGGSAGSGAVGAACAPAAERMPTFVAFDEQTVEVDTSAADCASSVCIVNHFRGRTTCPYGQDASGKPPAGAQPCTLPGGATAVTGKVSPQCSDRRAADTVHCSCRCANADGKTDDGATYCACPQGLACTQLVAPFGASNLAGAYCVKEKAVYASGAACLASCDPQSAPCP
jgi:hypothetical protein